MLFIIFFLILKFTSVICSVELPNQVHPSAHKLADVIQDALVKISPSAACQDGGHVSKKRQQLQIPTPLRRLNAFLMDDDEDSSEHHLAKGAHDQCKSSGSVQYVPESPEILEATQLDSPDQDEEEPMFQLNQLS